MVGLVRPLTKYTFLLVINIPKESRYIQGLSFLLLKLFFLFPFSFVFLRFLMGFKKIRDTNCTFCCFCIHLIGLLNIPILLSVTSSVILFC